MKMAWQAVYKIRHKRYRLGAWLFCFSLLLKCLVASVPAQSPARDLTNQTLEELMNIEVMSPSKKEEKLFEASSAIYVITAEDIRRSGLASLPELLRMVPGLQVARIDGSKYAISARGFNGRYANKLLVLVDGRSVYSPETAGVNWEAQDISLDEIERIEVIRGPGGTLWGANAVNGVINIRTKSASASQGFRWTASGGTQELGLSSARYGGKLGTHGFFKIYAQYNERSGLRLANNEPANDVQKNVRSGFRFDWQGLKKDNFTLQGEIFNSPLRENSLAVSLHAPLVLPGNVAGEYSGAHAIGRWQHKFSPGSESLLQVYFDRARRASIDVGERFDTLDVDWQHQITLGGRHGVIWGAGYRRIADNMNSNAGTAGQFTPTAQAVDVWSSFAQDDFTLIKDRLRLTVGAKVEHNDFSAFEFQPNARLRWTPTPRQTLWLAASGAVHTPVRVNRGFRVNTTAFPGPQGLPVVLAIFGSDSHKSEELRAYELGYRAQVHRRFTFDLATFYNAYDRLSNVEPGKPYPVFGTIFPPHIVAPLVFANFKRGETYGAEISSNAELTRHWQLRGSYSFLRIQIHRSGVSFDPTIEANEGESPRHQAQFHSYLNLPRNFEMDAAIYHVGAVTGLAVTRYTRLDARLGWRMRESVTLSFGAQNLLDARHAEFKGPTGFVIPSEIRRGIYAKLTMQR